MSREEWLQRFADHMVQVSKIETASAYNEAICYLDDVLDGDTSDDPEQAAQDAMEDWA